MKYVKAILIAVSAVAFSALVSVTVLQHRHINSLKIHVEEQGKVIDSLLARRMSVCDIHLDVTDKSRFAIYGRYNKGFITVPNTRTYILKIDSMSVSTK